MGTIVGVLTPQTLADGGALFSLLENDCQMSATSYVMGSDLSHVDDISSPHGFSFCMTIVLEGNFESGEKHSGH